MDRGLAPGLACLVGQRTREFMECGGPFASSTRKLSLVHGIVVYTRKLGQLCCLYLSFEEEGRGVVDMWCFRAC